MSEHMDDAVIATNSMTIIGIATLALGYGFEAKGLMDVGGVLTASGLVLNALSRAGRAISNRF